MLAASSPTNGLAETGAPPPRATRVTAMDIAMTAVDSRRTCPAGASEEGATRPRCTAYGNGKLLSRTARRLVRALAATDPAGARRRFGQPRLLYVLGCC